MRLEKKSLLLASLILIEVILGAILLKNRQFSHLVIWSITESSQRQDFYWPPTEAPTRFRFQEDNASLTRLKNEITALVSPTPGQFPRVLQVAKYTVELSTALNFKTPAHWGSPYELITQMKEGRAVDCFYRSIIISSYLATLEYKTRLWALENTNFEKIPHTVIEVYLTDEDRWVFLDATMGFYVSQGLRELSFLEFRQRLLEGKSQGLIIHQIEEGYDYNSDKDFFNRYAHLVRCVFLRTDNDFVDKFDNQVRYGFLSPLHKYLDRLPEELRMGLDYTLGRKDGFIHYVDKFSPSLKLKIAFCRTLYYLLVCSSIFLLFLFIKSLKSRKN